MIQFGSCNTFLARVGIGLAIQGAVLLLLTALPPWAHGDLDIEKVVTIALMVRFSTFYTCPSLQIS
jgi:hypothetical protein